MEMKDILIELEKIEDTNFYSYSLEIDRINRIVFDSNSKILKILSSICMLELNDIRSIELDKSTLNNLSKLVKEETLHYTLKSRLADILWLKIKSQEKIDYLKIAIENYMKYPLTITFENEWDRAISLLISTKGNIEQVKEKLLQTFQQTNDIDVIFINFLDKYNKKNLKYDNFLLISICENKLQNFTSYYDKQDFLERYIGLYNNKDEKYIELINYYEKTIEENNLNEIIGYTNIINCLHKIKNRQKYNVNEQLKKFQNKKIVFQKNMNFQTIGEQIDISGYVEETKQLLENKSTMEVFYQLAFFEENIIDILEDIKENDEDELLELLVGNLGVFDKGRKVLEKINKKENYYANYLHLFLYSRIFPSLKILSEHNITQELIFELCQKSSIIPNDRIEIWSKGIYYGFKQDFTISTSLLVPQIEHLLRMNLKNINENTINHKGNDGIEEEIGIDRLLDKNIKKFNQPIYQEFKLILTKPFNLRNDLAHGLINDKYFQTPLTIYFWWLVFKLIILNIKNSEIKL